MPHTIIRSLTKHQSLFYCSYYHMINYLLDEGRGSKPKSQAVRDGKQGTENNHNNLPRLHSVSEQIRGRGEGWGETTWTRARFIKCPLATTAKNISQNHPPPPTTHHPQSTQCAAPPIATKQWPWSARAGKAKSEARLDSDSDSEWERELELELETGGIKSHFVRFCVG